MVFGKKVLGKFFFGKVCIWMNGFRENVFGKMSLNRCPYTDKLNSEHGSCYRNNSPFITTHDDGQQIFLHDDGQEMLSTTMGKYQNIL